MCVYVSHVRVHMCVCVCVHNSTRPYLCDSWLLHLSHALHCVTLPPIYSPCCCSLHHATVIDVRAACWGRCPHHWPPICDDSFSNTWRLRTRSSDSALSFEPCPERQIGGWNGQMLVISVRLLLSLSLCFPLFLPWFLDLLCPNLCAWHDVIANKYICQANMSVSYQVFPSHKVGNENHVPFFFFCFFCFSHAWNFFGLTMCWRSQSVWARGASVCREKTFFFF